MRRSSSGLPLMNLDALGVAAKLPEFAAGEKK
jgi:hypothetical protein